MIYLPNGSFTADNYLELPIMMTLALAILWKSALSAWQKIVPEISRNIHYLEIDWNLNEDMLL